MTLEDQILQLSIAIEQLEAEHEDTEQERLGLAEMISEIPSHSKHLISDEVLHFANKVLGTEANTVRVLH
jgi:hypothetical protein